MERETESPLRGNPSEVALLSISAEQLQAKRLSFRQERERLKWGVSERGREGERKIDRV